ncbi:ABC transporter permease [Oceanihabitans sediminis]|uniref:ABC transporter permease n=1 Tax=Oceanihabitans sediminis TaxID=1812012 RepID=A0A368P4X7_9FLAO|nr:ABC transporter permease subunit [Oceanihabitans sediminis]MDX1278858.1 ABC transporter permease subunit [Oceanihabitans sediminis]MDX1774085.1 ABC transporter permease subunit [Oceanihabitans sediminis]RBP30874.1 ABC-2 family transporter [Oceanihabitans sediminis]RCU56839.1 ABC transporter permease [Oceanihabitans sediminis]
MLRLLQLELQKLLLNRVSKILIFVSFILPFTVLILSSIKINFFGFFTLELGELGIFNFPIIWHITTFFASQFKFFFAIVVVSMIGNEYSNKTIKQNLIDGLSKKEFILSKFYTIVFFSLVATLLIALASFVIGMYYSSYNEAQIIFRETNFLLAYFVKLVGFFTLCLFFGMLVKRSAFALAFLFILYILEWIALGLMTWKSDFELAEKIQNFFPLKSMYKLIDQPFQRVMMTKFPDKAELAYDYAVHWYEIAIVLGWTTLFLFLSYRILKNRDL